MRKLPLHPTMEEKESLYRMALTPVRTLRLHDSERAMLRCEISKFSAVGELSGPIEA